MSSRNYIREYLDEIEAKLEKIYLEQSDTIDRAAKMIADHIKTGK